MARKVVVTGFGVVSALGVGVEANAVALRRGETGVRRISAFDATGLPCPIGGEVPGFTAPPCRSRAFALLEAAAAEALFAASVRRGIDAALVLGTTLGGMEKGTAFVRDALARGLAGADASVLEDFLPSCQPVSLARKLGIRGRSIVLNNACSSGTDAIGQAFEMIRDGETDAAVAGGFEPLCEFIVRGFCSLQIVTPTACRPFDRNRDGMVLGEGAAVFVMETADAARARGARVVAEVAGFGASSDSHHMTQPDPDGAGVARAIIGALKSAGLGPRDIGYVNLHGTGTKLNDLAEYRGLLRSFGGALRAIPCSSTKGLTGHALGAAGAIEAAFCLTAIRDGFVPPNAGFADPDPDMPELRIAGLSTPARIKHAMSDSIGFGGGSSAVIFTAP